MPPEYLDWLKVKAPEEAVGLEVAVKGGKRLGSHGGDRRSEGVKEQGAISTLKTRGSTQADYILARLERDRPDILNKYLHLCFAGSFHVVISGSQCAFGAWLAWTQGIFK